MLEAQIEQGAPVDVFLSAGMQQMDALVERGLVESTSVRVAARNRLVVIVGVGKGTPMIHSLADLRLSQVRHIAIGDEKTVPAGQYAAEVLRKMDLTEILKPKLVQAEDVRQVVQYVVDGAAEAGFAYRTDARGVPSVRVALEIPDETHRPIVLPVAVIARTEFPEQAERFVEFLLGPDGQAVLDRYGFLPPGPPAGR